ncbi:MAG TPA: hypothetical protein VGX23_23255 [Actinocrinis sp.]|nr:hypothetical protein [Actinocrinis sp.]
MRQRPVLPTARAAVFTAVCVALAVAAHTWMSGERIPLWAVLAGLLPVFVVARLAAGRERSLAAILTLMGLDQTALHYLFTAAQQHADSAANAAGLVTVSPAAIVVQLPLAPLPGMTSIPAVPASLMNMPGMTGMPGMPSPAAMHMSAAMFVAHALAATVCAWWLRRGEAAVHEVFGTLAAWIADLLRLPVLTQHAALTAGPPSARPRETAPSRPVATFLRFAVARRGPPVSLSSCCV